MTIKFAIWAAVSTEAQAADDKASLEEQETKCRVVGESKGWAESAGPYIVPGKSRTRWVNLRDAENEIAPLKTMLEDAKSGMFDLLILYDYNRLRDHADPVAKTLISYGVQLYSISQPVEPIPPAEFTAYSTDSEQMMRGMSQIISRWQTADLRRKYRYGVAKRVRMGLPALKIPYGYAYPPGRTDNKAVPVVDPVAARVIIQMKDDYLAGLAHHGISRRADALTARPGHFYTSTVTRILVNPFYAG